MRAALVEQDDIAAGTSSRSSRLSTAACATSSSSGSGSCRSARGAAPTSDAGATPRQVEPLLFPIYGIPYAWKAFYDAGLTLYDVLGAPHDGGWHRRLSRAETLELAPTLRRDGLRGGLVYHDGIEDDARYTLAVARTAIAAGGVAVTRVRATGLRTGEGGAIAALRAEDLATGADLDISTRAIVDATGVWAAEPDQAFHSSSMRILPSRGAHLVVPRERIPNTMGMTIRVPGKIVFLVPWPHFWLIGTTDAPFEGPAARPSAAGWEVDHLIDTVNATMDVGLTRADVVGTYAGLGRSGRAVRRINGQGLARAPGHGRSQRRRPDGGGNSRPTGSWHATSSTPFWGERPRASDPLTPPSAAWSVRPTRTPWRGSPATCPPSRPFEAVGEETAARLVDRHGTEAPAVVALGAGLDAAAAGPGPPLPRGRGSLCGPPRARALARRCPGSAHAPDPGVAGSRRRHRPARRRDHGFGPRLGVGGADLEVENIWPAQGVNSRSRHMGPTRHPIRIRARATDALVAVLVEACFWASRKAAPASAWRASARGRSRRSVRRPPGPGVDLLGGLRRL